MSEVKERPSKAKAAPAAKPLTLGKRVDLMWELREKRRALDAESKRLDEEYKAIEQSVIEELKNQGSTRTDGVKATASLSTIVVPQVDDWEAFHKYILRNKYLHLLERRAAAAACRELFEHKGSIPGVTPFPKEGINLRTKE